MNKLIKSKFLKSVLLSYFRFKRGMICATEVAYYYGIADILCTDYKKIIEVEIKTSKADLKNDFLKKKGTKYKALKGEIVSKYIPNMFYICVPENLKNDALDYIQKYNPKFGLLVFEERYFKHKNYSSYLEAYIHVEKTADRLIKDPNIKFYKYIHRRLCNEVCQLNRDNILKEIVQYKLKNNFLNE